MLEQLEQFSWVVAFSNSVPAYAIVSIIHYLSFFLVVGTVVFMDLRVIGVAGRRQDATQLAAQLFPWTWIGIIFVSATGFIMFAGTADEYWGAGIFRFKVLVVLLAAVFTIIVQWGVPRWGRLPSMPLWAKLIALVSLVLWIGAILASVEVPAISGLG